MTELDTYVPVAERVGAFYVRFPTGRILTRLVENSPERVVVQAMVYRSTNEVGPSATGLAAERPGDGEINAVACLENTETSAIGRALANLGFLSTRRPALPRPQRESEVSTMAEAAARLDSLGVRTIYGEPPIVHSRARRSFDHVLAASTPESDDSATAELNYSLPVIRDLIRVLDDAQRHGMRPRRVAHWRSRIESGAYTAAALERLESWLRMWVRKARELDK